MRKSSLTLLEYQFLQMKYEDDDNYISVKNFQAIENFILSNEQSIPYLKVTTKKGYGKVLQAQNYVGVLQTKDGTTIEILPKIREVDVKTSKEILIEPSEKSPKLFRLNKSIDKY